MKRVLDLILAVISLTILAIPVLLLTLLVMVEDGGPPWYRGVRVGRHGRIFRMVKLRSMVVNADRRGARSTAGDDPRITRMGAFMRRFKLDELPQLWNIARGDMSFVGPRPNVPAEVALYSAAEREILSIRPGATDFASIVFSDEADILRGSSDANRDYNLLIRPWKSRLALHYIKSQSLLRDAELIALTVLAAVSRTRALLSIRNLLERTGADDELIRIAGRNAPLAPSLPPGATAATWQAHLP